MKTIVVDLDGTICDEKPTFERSLALPKEGVDKVLEAIASRGYRIIIYTARGWAEYEATKVWLENYRIRYDELIMGKPIYDLWIDDRAMEFTSWEDILKIL